VVTNVENLMQQDGGFERLWKRPAFTSRLISFVWDEGHCASLWTGFRPEYKEVNRLRYLIPRDIPFVIVSATLPPAVLSDVMNNLQVSPSLEFIAPRWIGDEVIILYYLIQFVGHASQGPKSTNNFAPVTGHRG
jgi:superfamily II DNA helicase RecQ